MMLIVIDLCRRVQRSSRKVHNIKYLALLFVACFLLACGDNDVTTDVALEASVDAAVPDAPPPAKEAAVPDIEIKPEASGD